MAHQPSAPLRPSAGRPGTAPQLPRWGQKMLRSKEATVPGFTGNETHLLVMNVTLNQILTLPKNY